MKLGKNIAYRLNSYFKSRLGMTDYNRGWLKGNCPECGKEQKYGVNLSSNRTNCFVCGYNRQPFNVMMDVENFSTKHEAMHFLMEFQETGFVEYAVEVREEKDVLLPEGFKLILFGDNHWGKKARNYLSNRGFNVNELAYSGWGYCTRGKHQGYIIIPFYKNGKLFYFNARSYMGGGTKYKNPTADDFGIGKSKIIYNIDALQKYDKIYIVESVMNAQTLGDQAIALGGKAISSAQYSDIIKSTVSKCIIILDSDANKEAIKQASELVFYKKVKVIFMPEDKDVNDIGKKATMKLIHKSKWLSYNDIIKLKNKYA